MLITHLCINDTFYKKKINKKILLFLLLIQFRNFQYRLFTQYINVYLFLQQERRALNNEFLNLLFSHSGPVRQKFIKILEFLPLSFTGCQLSKFLPSKEMRALPEDDFTAHNIYMTLVLLTIYLQLSYCCSFSSFFVVTVSSFLLLF